MIHPHDIYSNTEPWTVRIVYLAREFAKRGHSVRLAYFPLIWNGQEPLEIQRSITVIPLCRRLGLYNLIFNILKLYRLAKCSDIVHFQKCFYHAAIPAITAALLSKKPIHYDWDDWEVKIYEISSQPGVIRNFIRGFLNLLECTIPKIVDTISVASSKLKIECEKLGIGEDKISEAHVGADLEKFNPKVSGKYVRSKYNIENQLVLYLGQLHGGQYAKLFIESAAKLINNFKCNLTFMIVGDGYQAEELKKTASELNLNGRLIFAGAVSHELVPEYIAAADICVASFEENDVTICKSPLKIVEYLASGKAIVASRVGEMPNMVGEAGILTLPGNAQSLAMGIIKAYENDALRISLGRLARQRAENKYNWTITANNLLAAYGRAIQAKYAGN